jgi:hypothetical protein
MGLLKIKVTKKLENGAFTFLCKNQIRSYNRWNVSNFIEVLTYLFAFFHSDLVISLVPELQDWPTVKLRTAECIFQMLDRP